MENNLFALVRKLMDFVRPFIKARLFLFTGAQDRGDSKKEQKMSQNSFSMLWKTLYSFFATNQEVFHALSTQGRCLTQFLHLQVTIIPATLSNAKIQIFFLKDPIKRHNYLFLPQSP
jgi:hypothetical protein